MDQKLWKKAEEMANKHYTVIVAEGKESTGKSIFLAKTLELYGCMAQGSTIEEALSNLKDAEVDYIYSLLEDGISIPEPIRIYSTVDTSCTPGQNEFNLFKTISFEHKVSDSKPLYAVSVKC